MITDISAIVQDTRHTLQQHRRKLIVIILFLRVGGRALTYGVANFFQDLPITLEQ